MPGEGEERAGVQPPGAGPVGLDRADHGAVGVADGHALGPAGRPRGVEDVGQVLGLRAAPGTASGPRRWPRPSESSRGVRRRRPGLRAGVDQGEEAARPRLGVAAAAGRRRPRRRWPPSARACGPPRPGPAGGSWGRRRRRPGGRPSTRRASAAPARAAGGCRRGRRARDRPRGGGGPWRWPPVPLGEGHGPDVDDGKGCTSAEFLGHAGKMIVHQHAADGNRCEYPAKRRPGGIAARRCRPQGQMPRLPDVARCDGPVGTIGLTTKNTAVRGGRQLRGARHRLLLARRRLRRQYDQSRSVERPRPH